MWDFRDEYYMCPIMEVIGISDLSMMIVEYLPTMHVDPLRKRDATGRYFITVDLSTKMNDREFSNRWMTNLDIEYQKLFWIFYHSNPVRTFILLNTGSQYETHLCPNEKGLLVSESSVGTLDILKSLICTSNDLLNVAINELTDSDFAHQWIHYVGCHGYRCHTSWSWSESSKNVISSVENASFKTYIKKYWEERKKNGCQPSEHSLCHNDRVCMNDAMHHHCRENNEVECAYLRECMCFCENCITFRSRINSQKHQCLTPDAWLCFNNWNPPPQN